MTSVMPLRGRTPFQDEAGQYPALDGCAPASIGKRAAGRLLDSALGMAVAIVSYLPGMVVSVDILTGKKTILTYLLKPVLRARHMALRER